MNKENIFKVHINFLAVSMLVTSNTTYTNDQHNDRHYMSLDIVHTMLAQPAPPPDIFAKKEFGRRDAQPINTAIVNQLPQPVQERVTANILKNAAQPAASDQLLLTSPLSLLTNLTTFPYPLKSEDRGTLSLINQIDRTVTLPGRLTLAHMLANPLRNQDELKKRQTIIRAFTEDANAFKACNDILARHQESIGHATYCFQASQAVVEKQHVDTQLLFPKFIAKLSPALLKKLNHSRTALAAYSAVTPFSCFCLLAVTGTFTIRGNVASAPTTLSIAAMTGIASYGYQTKFLNSHTYLHAQFTHLARALETVDALNQLAQKNPQLKELQKLLEETMHVKPPSENFKRICNLLRSSTFKQEPSKIFAAFDNTVLTYSLFQEVQEECTRIFACIGKVDAILSMAKLYQQSQTTNNRYSFVQFENTDTPLLEVQDFWNPLIPKQHVVTNSIRLAGDGSSPRALVITGSNSGGKSAIAINGIGSTVLIAQTTGIAPAASCKMRPFDYIKHLAKITENTNKGLSHLTATIKKTKDVASEIRSLAPNQVGLILADELFEGTDAPTELKISRKFIEQYILPHKNILSIHVTQHNDLKGPVGLEQSGLCENYCVDATINEKKEVVRPHQLKRGISDSSIGEKLFDQAFAGMSE